MQNLSCRSHQWSGSSSHTWGQSQDIFDGPNGPENQNSIQIQGTKDRAWRKGVFLLTGLPGPPSGAGPDRELRGFGASRVQKARWGEPMASAVFGKLLESSGANNRTLGGSRWNSDTVEHQQLPPTDI